MTRQDKITALLRRTAREPEYRARFLSDPVGVAADMGLTLTPAEEGRAALLQADTWTGAVDSTAPVDSVFCDTPAERTPRVREPEIDPYVRREPWRQER